MAGHMLQGNDVAYLETIKHGLCSCHIYVMVPTGTTLEEMKDEKFVKWGFYFKLQCGDYRVIHEDLLRKLVPKYMRVESVPENNRLTVRGIVLPALPPSIFEERIKGMASYFFFYTIDVCFVGLFFFL
jgi:hypothetical protein